MQLMIDLAANNQAATLRRVAAMLLAIADGDAAPAPSVPSGTVDETRYVRPADVAPVVPAPPAPSIPSPPAAIVPPPPPPAPDTTATIASAASTAPIAHDPNAQLDKRGFPYDARIHSAGANINKSDGLWRTKRGVDNSLIESVEAELRERGYGVAVPPAPLSPPAPPAPPAPPPAPGAVPPPPPPPVSLPVGTGAPGQPPAVPSGQDAGQVDQFRVLMNTIGGHTGPDGKCRREIMAPVYERLLGKPGGLPDFHKARDKIPELLVEVRRLIGA